MAGINGIHVRAAVAFLDSPRFLKLSLDAQSLWLHLHKYALNEKREFLPLDYDVPTIAYLLHQPEDKILAAFDELTTGTRPIINTLQDGRIRIRGARDKQPLGWRDESEDAELWNTENPTDQVDIVAFGRVYQSGQAKKSQVGDSKGLAQTQPKCGASAARTRGKRDTFANRREEKRRKENTTHSHDECTAADSSSTEVDSSAQDNRPASERVDGRLVDLVDGLATGWNGASDETHQEARKLAIGLMDCEQGPRVIAYMREINDKNTKQPWEVLKHMIVTIKAPQDRLYDDAKKEIRRITEGPHSRDGPVEFTDALMPAASKKKRGK